MVSISFDTSFDGTTNIAVHIFYLCRFFTTIFYPLTSRFHCFENHSCFNADNLSFSLINVFYGSIVILYFLPKVAISCFIIFMTVSNSTYMSNCTVHCFCCFGNTWIFSNNFKRILINLINRFFRPFKISITL